MCLTPIQIINPSKFLSKNHRERYLMTVKCGKCAECMRDLANEWYFRSWHEFMNTIETGGYVLFDTLTYRNKHLPRLSSFFPDDIKRGSKLDYPCFDHSHYRLFFVNLRTYLTKRGYNVADNLSYQFVSEYGADQRYTHRPHYHVLMYVRGGVVPPLVLSAAIAKCWRFGRTDGVTYKGRYYVMSKRVYSSKDHVNVQFVARYVSKYLQKSSKFHNEIDRRIEVVYQNYLNNMPKDYDKSEQAKLYRRSIVRLVDQFHRQSHHFGESFLRDFDIDSFLDSDGSVSMPDYQSVKLSIPFPMYYKRKLFYELISFGERGRAWSLTSLGKLYQDKRYEKTKRFLLKRLEELNQRGSHRVRYSPTQLHELTDYISDRQGRLRGHCPDVVSLTDKLDTCPLWFNYITSTDKVNFQRRFVTSKYCGIKDEYKSVVAPDDSFSLSEFISANVVYEQEYEDILSDLYSRTDEINKSKQSCFDFLQVLSQKIKVLKHK